MRREGAVVDGWSVARGPRVGLKSRRRKRGSSAQPSCPETLAESAWGGERDPILGDALDGTALVRRQMDLAAVGNRQRGWLSSRSTCLACVPGQPSNAATVADLEGKVHGRRERWAISSQQCARKCEQTCSRMIGLGRNLSRTISAQSSWDRAALPSQGQRRAGRVDGRGGSGPKRQAPTRTSTAQARWTRPAGPRGHCRASPSSGRPTRPPTNCWRGSRQRC